MNQVVSYGLLSDDALGGRSVWAGGLLVLDVAGCRVPGSRGRLLLLRGEPGGDVAEHLVR